MPEEDGGACILDLGCGVGESMLYLAQQTTADFKYYGITVSGKQATSASRRISGSGLSNHVQVIEGSFQLLPPGLPSIDMGYAIESFIHSVDPDGFFTQVASVLNHGARLVIFDDFLSRQPRSKEEVSIIKDLKEGWLANTLLTQSEVQIVADKKGFQLELSTDFSGILRLRRMRDRFVHLMAPFARPWMHRSQYCRFLVGGDARQRAYQHGLLQYAMLVFVKR
jgi:cyclopropane fatty-acyl-phospholipid synthase-like methyltransferase